MYIAALCPPNNVDIALLKIKREIFYEKSMLSAWALRPMVPFLLFTQQPKKPERKTLPKLPSGGLEFSSVPSAERQLFLKSAECKSLCADIGALPEFAEMPQLTSQEPGVFQAVSGLQLLDLSEEGSSDALDLIKLKTAELEDSVLRWRNCCLCLFEAEFSDRVWWEQLTLEQLWCIHLQKEPSH